MLLTEVKARFFSKFEYLEKSFLNFIFNSAKEMSKTFRNEVLKVANKENFAFIKSRDFNATIVETYIETVLLMDATLQNRPIEDIVAYIYSNPVKNHPLVTLIQERTFAVNDKNRASIERLHEISRVKPEDMIQRLATAKSYLQRSALLERMNSLEDKPTTSKKIKI
jgi:hypothetical protein